MIADGEHIRRRRLAEIDEEVRMMGDTCACPIVNPFNPHASISRPAASPGGFWNIEPADAACGWAVFRQS